MFSGLKQVKNDFIRNHTTTFNYKSSILGYHTRSESMMQIYYTNVLNNIL